MKTLKSHEINSRLFLPSRFWQDVGGTKVKTCKRISEEKSAALKELYKGPTNKGVTAEA